MISQPSNKMDGESSEMCEMPTPGGLSVLAWIGVDSAEELVGLVTPSRLDKITLMKRT